MMLKRSVKHPYYSAQHNSPSKKRKINSHFAGKFHFCYYYAAVIKTTAL